MAKRTYISAKGKKLAEARRKKAIILLVIAGVAALALFIVGFILLSGKKEKAPELVEIGAGDISGTEPSLEGAPPIDVQLLTPNEYSRPQIKLQEIKGVVIHYLANPGSSAQDNRNYFENLKDTHTTKASSHFIIGLDGEIIQCIPTSEIAYTSNERNSDTVSIENCHPDETGEFTTATYNSLVELTGWLCWRSGLNSSDVIRHHDVTGKICPKYFVDNEDAWQQFLTDVQSNIDGR